jgi:hypothetical protein
MAHTLSRRLVRSQLFHYVRGVVLVPPTRGRSVFYESLGNEAFYQRLKDHGDFCRDTQLGGALHPRRPSFREVNRAPSLHISLERHDRLAVHLDRSGPAVGRSPNGGCIYERSRAAKHMREDVFPSLTWTWGTSEHTGRRWESAPSGRHLPLLVAEPSPRRPSFLDRAAAFGSPFTGPHFILLQGGAESPSVRTPPPRPPPEPPSLEVCEGGDVRLPPKL